MREELLIQLKEMVPTIKKMVDLDLSITIIDITGVLLFYSPSESIKFELEVGSKLPPEVFALINGIENGKIIHNVMKKEDFGISAEGKIVPIFDEGQVVGCISCMYSVKERVAMEEKMEHISHSLQLSSDSITNILTNSQEATKYLNEIHHFVDELNQSVQEVAAVAKEIRANASRTKNLSTKCIHRGSASRRSRFGI